MNDVNEMDRLCIRQVLSGRKEAYAMLVDCYGRSVFRLVASMVPLKEDAEELAQDAFVRAYEQLSSYDEHRASFYTWVSRIAYRLCTDHYRRRPAVWLETDERALQQVSDREADEVMGRIDQKSRRRPTGWMVAAAAAIAAMVVTGAALLQINGEQEASVGEVAQATAVQPANAKPRPMTTDAMTGTSWPAASAASASHPPSSDCR